MARKNKKLPPAEPLRIGKIKRWVFRIVSIVFIPVLFFGTFEVGLRLLGFGYPSQAIIERQVDGKTTCFLNTLFTRRFFPPHIAREFDGSLVFNKDKSPDTYRIFVLGGSAAMGMPDAMYNFGRILEVMLSDMYPDINFEVHNAAIVAINSHVVREIAKDCAKYDPDLFIVYLGNNEVVGPYGPGTVLTSATPNLALIRANIALKSTRTGQVLEQMLGSIHRSKEAPLQWAGMEMFLGKQVRFESPALESVYSHFKTNLQDICNIARGAGAEVIISNVGANLKDSPPFASLYRDDLTESEKQTWLQRYQSGIDQEAEGSYTQAIESYLAAAEIDETFADLQFRLGRCYWNVGEYEKARDCYEKALQDDTLRFRADDRINEIIRSVADQRKGEGIYFADSVTAFEENSPHRTPGEELFYEHVHLNFTGNYTLAKTVFASIREILPATAARQSGTVLSEDEVAQRLAYTDFERYYDLNRIYEDMLLKPPFTNQLYHDAFTSRVQAEVEKLHQKVDPERCLQEYQTVIQEHPDDWRLLLGRYTLLVKTGQQSNPEVLEPLLYDLLKLHPYHPAYLTLGKVLMSQGKLPQAREILNQLLEIKPNSAKAHLMLADAAFKTRDTEGAIRHLEQGIRIDPAVSIVPYGFLAETYEKSGKTKKAIRTLYRAIEVFPEQETSQIHFDLGKLLYAQGEYEKAQTEMKEALKINPNLADNPVFMMLLNNLNVRINQ